MSANVEIKLKLSDQASAGLKAASKQVQLAAAQAAQSNERMATKSSAAFVRMSRARETLGIRSEHAVQREIQRTEASYNRLLRAGKLSANEIARAQIATKNRVKELNAELKGTEKSFGSLNRLAGLGIGAAAGMYLKNAASKSIDYDRTVAKMTNTMFADRDASGRIAGKAEIKDAITAALDKGGGTREQAAATMDELMSSGEFDKARVFSLTGSIQKAATASGAESTDLAKIALAAKRNGVKPEEIELALSKAIRAGQLGGFELNDMARSLPAVLASARARGINGMAGFERVLASMQSSVLTAGTKDEAANNLLNIMEKLDAPDTIKDFAKQGINLPAEYEKGALRGEDQLTTFVRLIDQVIAKDPKIKALSAELDQLTRVAQDKTNPRNEEALKKIKEIYANVDVGKFLQDRQALQGFRAESQGQKSGSQDRVLAGIKQDNGQELATSYAVMDDTASAKMERLNQNKLRGEDEMLTGAGSLMKPLFDGLVGASTEFPKLTAATTAATSALGLLAGAALLNVPGAGGKLLSGGKAVLGGAGRLAATAGGALFSTSGAAVLGAGAVGYGVGTLANYGIDKGLSAMTGKDTNLGAWLYDVLHSDAIGKAADPAKVQTEVVIKAAPEFRVQSQTTSTSGPVKNFMHTGSIWGTP